MSYTFLGPWVGYECSLGLLSPTRTPWQRGPGQNRAQGRLNGSWPSTVKAQPAAEEVVVAIAAAAAAVTAAATLVAMPAAAVVVVVKAAAAPAALRMPSGCMYTTKGH
eukprot:TRINITY_DN54_c0_g2_i4.p3 TRINITY_DN54_c0_g2~~TRINITY_DN54_c0_g2_i4.p3  ORF type:complete len:108 (+),score=23.79 TRINITY_DN54_c0_g2_i4:272-595(+)